MERRVSDAVVVEDLAKRYGAVKAVDGISFSVPRGAVLGLVGPNGAGKTTTLGLLSGLLRPDRGRIQVGGRPLRPGVPPRGRVAALPQDSALPADRRIVDELRWLARLQGSTAAGARDAVDRALSATGLADVADRRIGRLSHGQRRRVGIAQALLGAEEVVVLDEPTAGVDPRSALEIRRDLRALLRDRTVIWSSHDLSEVEELCTHVLILDRGRVAASGPMDDLRHALSVLTMELAPDVPADLSDTLSAVVGVQRVDIDTDARRVTLRCDPSASLDEVTLHVLQLLIERRLFVRGLVRGERLAESFWAATSRDGSR